MEPKLWQIENYREFLAARRKALADAANQFLNGLVSGEMPESRATVSILEREVAAIPGGVESEDEEQVIQECNTWVIQLGLQEGERSYELTDQATGQPIAVIDLAWPDGIQKGYSQPVALMLNEEEEIRETVNRAGFRYFTDVDSFKEYVKREVLAVVETATSG